jgi:Ca-activated chloride channel family protein
MVFSRVGVLAAGPRAGRATTLLLFMLRNLLLASTIVALSRPRSGAHAEDVTSEGINIVLAIDLSSSMLAQDFQPQNRLEVAKDVVKRFILARHSDRIGVVAFAAEALTQVPLTTDYPVVSAAVDNLAAGQLEDGTAIGTAIATAANRPRDAPGRSRVMIVLTDGENNRGAIDPRTAAKAAAVFGIKIYTIGVGTEGMAPVPVGRGLFGLRYENRVVRIDEPLLSDVAKSTGGRYYRARDAAALQRIYEEINSLEREPVRTRSYVRYRALSLAALLRGADARRRASPRRAPRAAAMSEITFDYPYALALAIVLPLLAVIVLRHAFRQRRARLQRLGNIDVVSRLIPPNTLKPPGWRMVRLGLASAFVDSCRRSAVGR